MGHRQLRDQPQGMVLGSVQAPLSLEGRRVGVHPCPRTGWGGREKSSPHNGYKPFPESSAPKGREQSCVQAEKGIPSSALWGRVCPSPLYTVVWDTSVPLALLLVCKASSGLTKSPVP